jgi:hypothetical protein
MTLAFFAAPALVCSRRGETEFFENLTFETRGIPGLAIIPSIHSALCPFVHSFIHPSIYLFTPIDLYDPLISISDTRLVLRKFVVPLPAFLCIHLDIHCPAASSASASSSSSSSSSVIFQSTQSPPITQTHQYEYHDHYPVSVSHSTFDVHP